MKFVNIEKGDFDELAILFNQEFSKDPWHEAWTDQTSLAHLLAIYESYGFIGYKVYEDECIGFILGNLDPSYMGTLFWIKEFIILSSYQSKGYGKRLLLEFEALLKEKDVCGILLWTNHATIPFYKKCGYDIEKDLCILKKVLDV